MSEFNFTIGADPEIFVVDANKRAVSAHGLVPGTKESPHPVPDGAIQVDGMALEFNIAPTPLKPQAFLEFNSKIVNVMKSLKTSLNATRDGFRPLKFNIVPTQEFDPEYMLTVPDEAKELGCNPDMNAYTLEENPRPEAEAVNFRTASGHIHIGWGADIPVDNPEHIQICADFVKMLDMTVGLYMTVIDSDSKRRQLYGKAGAFRPKPYGVEYRTPSNAWLTSKERRRNVFMLVEMAVNIMKTGRTPQHYLLSDIQSIIDHGDFFAAQSAIDALYRNSAFPYASDYNLYNRIVKDCNARSKTNVSA